MNASELNGDAVQEIAVLAQGAGEVQNIEVWPGKEGQVSIVTGKQIGRAHV